MASASPVGPEGEFWVDARQRDGIETKSAPKMTALKDNRARAAKLEADILANADSHQAVRTTLATSERIIARVTDGIYREPWAAFRELAANAYDADASYVVIATGQPRVRSRDCPGRRRRHVSQDTRLRSEQHRR